MTNFLVNISLLPTVITAPFNLEHKTLYLPEVKGGIFTKCLARNSFPEMPDKWGSQFYGYFYCMCHAVTIQCNILIRYNFFTDNIFSCMYVTVVRILSWRTWFWLFPLQNPCSLIICRPFEVSAANSSYNCSLETGFCLHQYSILCVCACFSVVLVNTDCSFMDRYLFVEEWFWFCLLLTCLVYHWLCLRGTAMLWYFI